VLSAYRATYRTDCYIKKYCTSTSLCKQKRNATARTKTRSCYKKGQPKWQTFFNCKHRTPFIYVTKPQIRAQMKYTYFPATLCACLASIRSQDSPFGTASRLGATHRGIVFRFVAHARDCSLLQSDQTDYGAALASYSMITRVKPTTHLQLVQRLRMSGAVP